MINIFNFELPKFVASFKGRDNSNEIIEKCLSALKEDEVKKLYNEIRKISGHYQEQNKPVIVYYKKKYGPLYFSPVKWQTGGGSSENGMATAHLQSLLYKQYGSKNTVIESSIFKIIETMEKLESEISKGKIKAKDVKPYSGDILFVLYRAIAQLAYYHFTNEPHSKIFRRTKKDFQKLNQIFQKIYGSKAEERVKRRRRHIKDYEGNFSDIHIPEN